MADCSGVSRAPTHGPLGVYSIVVELENAAIISWEKVRDVLLALATQIRELAEQRPDRRAEVLFVHADRADQNSQLLLDMRRHVPSLFDVATIRFLSCPQGRYYQLKNAGIVESEGEVIIILDSDAVPQRYWLKNILEPFRDPKTVAVNGYTYLSHSDLISRTLALIWFFPLCDQDVKCAERRALNANNCAFRASWIKDHLFPIDTGFKVDCTLLAHDLRNLGHESLRVPAYAAHAPLRGWRFLVWRARVTGRDADRKYTRLKSNSLVRRFVNAVLFWYKMERRACTRILRMHGRVAMPSWQVPTAIMLAIAFYSLCFVGQIELMLGIVRDQPEHVPAFAEHH